MERECVIFPKDEFTTKGNGFDISVKANESTKILPEPTCDSDQCAIIISILRFKEEIMKDPSTNRWGANGDCYACGQFINVDLRKVSEKTWNEKK